jgi:hypothetical protein
MHTMKGRALCIAYPEKRFYWGLKRLERHLKKEGHVTEFVVAGNNPLAVIWALRRAVTETPPDKPLLVVFNGHGLPTGWTGEMSGFLIYIIPYVDIASILKKRDGPLVVISDTCYGARFANHLKKFRDPKDTGFIAPWDGEDICYGGPTKDAVEFWPQGFLPEEIITRNLYSGPDGDKEVPLQFRWGATLDGLFMKARASS